MLLSEVKIQVKIIKNYESNGYFVINNNNMITELIALKASFETLRGLNKDSLVLDEYYRDRILELQDKLKSMEKDLESEMKKVSKFISEIEYEKDLIDEKAFVKNN